MKKLSGNRILIEKDGYVVVYHEDNEKNIIPTFCEVCNCMLRTLDDEIAYNQFKCCDDCTQQFARPNVERWQTGWRPDDSELKKAISRRSPIFINIC